MNGPSALRTLLRSLFRVLPLPWRIRIRRRITLLYWDAGYGDSLLAGAVAREIKRHYGQDVKVCINGVRGEMLLHNPHVDEIGQRYDGVDLNYHYGRYNVGKRFERNILDVMCRKVGIACQDHTVDFYPSRQEVHMTHTLLSLQQRPIITIQTTPGEFGHGRRAWLISHWRSLAEMLVRKGMTVVHLGSEDEQPIAGTVSMLGKLGIREAIAVISQADVHVGVVSSLMHASEAVGTPAVIIFGGFEPYAAHGYRQVTPFESSLDCAPCITPATIIGECPRQQMCMEEISPEAVFKQIEAVLQKDRIVLQHHLPPAGGQRGSSEVCDSMPGHTGNQATLGGASQ